MYGLLPKHGLVLEYIYNHTSIYLFMKNSKTYTETSEVYFTKIKSVVFMSININQSGFPGHFYKEKSTYCSSSKQVPQILAM